MKESSNKRAIIVGIFIIVGLLFLVGSVLIIGDLRATFQRKMMVSSIFEDVSGLHLGNNIWFSGVKIGTVKKLEFSGKSQVKVVMNINTESKQYIRKDAKVKIGTDGLIGNKILIIYGGTAIAPEIEENDTLSNELMLTTDDIMNTFQQNNLNILQLTKKLNDGEGTIGKLLNNEAVYDNIFDAARSLHAATAKAQILVTSLIDFSSKLNKKGTLANDLVTDTFVFNSLKTSVLKLQNIADTASVFVNKIKDVRINKTSSLGILLQDEKVGASLKTTISNLEIGSQKLNEDLEALQHSFLLRRYFKKKLK